MTIKKISLANVVKVSPTPALKVPQPERLPASLVEKEPLAVLGNKRVPEVIAPPVVPSSQSLFGPRGVCLLSPDGPLWICDTGHHRLLGWKTMPHNDMVPADWIIGQADFACEGRNGKQPVSAATLNVPTGICAVGAAGASGASSASSKGLAVADAWNHRVLIWHKSPDANNQPADVVLGQSDFQSNDANRGREAPDSDTLFWPYGVAFENNKLIVADSGNRRVLIWNELPSKNGQRADRVLGQSSFAVRDENAGGEPSAMSMRWPHAITIWQEMLCVTDAGNNRVMIWQDWHQAKDFGAPADYLLGQRNENSVDHNQSLYWPRENSLNMPYGIAASEELLYVADTANSRLLAWRKSDLVEGSGAHGLFGQQDFNAKGDNRWQPATSDSLCWPYALQAKDGYLLIADTGNNRVSIWKVQ